MDITKIKLGLVNYDSARVSVYANYLSNASTAVDRDKKLKNPWMQYAKDEDFIQVFKKVALDNLWIDGNSVTLEFRGEVKPRYNYQAYKNRLLSIYPETIIDLQLVNEGDNYSFKKESGKIIYTHDFGDPFETEKTIIGAYCIIKNHRGEFIETLNISEITKMKNVAKTKTIWDAWYGEMIMKSVIKRACKRHFKDEFQRIEEIDNEVNDLDLVNLDGKVQEIIHSAKTAQDLKSIYTEFTGKKGIDEVAFLKALDDKKKELKEKAETV